MAEVYDYRRFTIRPRTWPAVLAAIRQDGARAVTDAGGTFYGVWTPQIGLSSNDGIAMSVWPSAETARGDGVLAGSPDIVASRGELLSATLRPTTPAPPTGPGVYVHRWFELQASDTEEFEALSGAAWPTFEAAFDARIVGLFRARQMDAPAARYLLLTRYASLAVWEQSRRPDLDPAAWDRFRRRHALTASTIAVTTVLGE